MKINICMLLGLRYKKDMQIVPQIGIASYITNFGHDVTWILSSGNIKKVQEATYNDVRVFNIPYKYRKGFFGFITKGLYVFRKLTFLNKNFKQENYNLIFVRRGSVIDELLALYIKKKYNVPLIFQMENPLGQSWEERKVYSKHKYYWYFISKIEAYLRIQVLRQADLVLPTTEWLKEDLIETKIERSKLMPFPNGIDPDRFSDANGDEIRKKYRLEDLKVIIYVGTLGKLRYLDVLIRAFSQVRAKKRNVILLIVGGRLDESNLERLSKELDIGSDVIFTGQVGFHEIPHFIAAADIGVSPVPPLDFYKLSSPIKMFEYMVMRKPVVANEEIPEQKEVIEESGGGVLVKFEDESFANGIIEILDNSKKAKEMGGKGYEWVVKNRSYEFLARKLEKKYLDLSMR